MQGNVWHFFSKWSLIISQRWMASPNFFFGYQEYLVRSSFSGQFQTRQKYLCISEHHRWETRVSRGAQNVCAITIVGTILKMGSTVDFFTWQLFQHVNLLWQICTHSYNLLQINVLHEVNHLPWTRETKKKKGKNDQGSCKYKLFMQIFCGETWKKLGLWQDLKQWCQCYALTNWAKKPPH